MGIQRVSACTQHHVLRPSDVSLVSAPCQIVDIWQLVGQHEDLFNHLRASTPEARDNKRFGKTPEARNNKQSAGAANLEAARRNGTIAGKTPEARENKKRKKMLVWPCCTCRRELTSDSFTEWHWKQRKKRAVDCVACKPLFTAL